jgi:hypothetical protein
MLNVANEVRTWKGKVSPVLPTGGGPYQGIVGTISFGQTDCAPAKGVTDGSATHVSGSVPLWTLGGGGIENFTLSSRPLPDANSWAPVRVCAATSPLVDDGHRTLTIARDAADVGYSSRLRPN